MKEIINSRMSSLAKKIDELKSVINIEGGLKRTSFFEQVKKAFGKKFNDKIQPLCLKKDGILIISCKNSMVTNELFMLKDDALKKVQELAKPLSIEISDIVFSHKYWQEPANEDDVVEEQIDTPKISTEELDKIEISEDEIESLRKAVEKNSFISAEQKEKMLNAIILNLKEQKYKELKN